MIRFRVLGTIAAERDGTALAVLNAQLVRRLLAALLCRANSVVSTDDLISALWGEDAPPSARTTLQVYIRRLRAALDDGRIVHEAGGYRINVEEDELDSLRFEQLTAVAAPERDQQRAVERLQQALELWRGNAFEDAREHSPMTEQARRLDEERLRIESEFVRLLLEVGRHTEAITRLWTLTETHPCREDLRGHLMLALYRAGRQTEALEVFRSTRKLLDDELGVEPGPELQQLHEAILRADPALRVPKRQHIPRELPADVGGFVGRSAQLQALDDMLPDPSPVVISAIAGSAGVGKTALAVHWAHTVAGRFPDGQLYINLRGFDPAGPPMSPPDAIRRFLDALGVSPQRIPADTEAQIALYRSLLADKRMLVILDNARDAEQVRPLLPGSPTSMVVITSRNRLASLVATNGARPMMLDVLTEPEARQLLAKRLGAARVTAEPDAVDEITNRCARLPLALAIAAARAATEPKLSLADLASELRDSAGGLAVFDSEDPLTDLRAVFSWSYQQLSTDAARLFRLLGLHPGPDTSAPAVASLAGVPLQQVKPLLSELTHAHLLTEHAPGRYTFHDLLRAYAAEQAERLDPEPERQAAIHRLLDHYLHTAHVADKLRHPEREPIALGPSQFGVIPEELEYRTAAEWLDAESHVLLAVVQHAADAGFDTHTCQLAWTLTRFLNRSGRWRDWVAIQQASLVAAKRLGDLDMQATTHRSLGGAHATLGEYGDAYTHLHAALVLNAERGDVAGQAHARRSLAWVFEREGRYTDALSHLKQALNLFRQAGRVTWEAKATSDIGWIYARLGDFGRALRFCQQALTRLQALGDHAGEASVWDSLGYIHHHSGRYSNAKSCYRRALELYRDLGYRHYEAEVLTHLGDCSHSGDDNQEAHHAWQQALIILTELGHLDADKVRAKLHCLRQDPS